MANNRLRGMMDIRYIDEWFLISALYWPSYQWVIQQYERKPVLNLKQMQRTIKKIAGIFDGRKYRYPGRGPRITVLTHWKERSVVPIQYGAFFLILFGIKLLTIYVLGNATPFGDQWDAEAANLYKPFLDHTLEFKNFIVPHNEHRILTTRLLALALLQVNQLWNPLLQMVVNAALHVLAVILAVYLLNKAIGGKHQKLLLGFSLILFSFPYAWENTLVGFQSQFYFVMLFGLAALWLLITAEPLGWRWWAGILCAILAYFSLASGVFVLAAAAAIGIFVFLTRLRRNARQLGAVVILIALFTEGVIMTPKVPGHELLKAASVRQLYDALVAVFGWPVGANFSGAFFCNIPVAIFILVMLWKRPPLTDRKWFLLTFSVWAITQALSISYGRGTGVDAPRYRDLFALLVMANFTCLLSLVQNFSLSPKKLPLLLAGVWTGLMIIALGLYAGNRLPPEIAIKLERNKAEETNMRDYVATRDISYLKDKPEWFIPYPDPDALARTLALPGILEILPSNITPSFRPDSVIIQPENSFKVNGYYFTTPAPADSTWGSWTKQKGDSSRGQLSLHFKSNYAGMIAIPMAGYPLRDNIKLEVEQNGVSTRVIARHDPRENWGSADAMVKKGEFILRVTDSSTTTWLAIGNPSVTGRLDRRTNWLLSHYYCVIMAGIALVIFLVLDRMYSRQATNLQIQK